MVFWLATTCSVVVGYESFGGRAAYIFRVDVHDQGDIYTALLPTHTGSRCVIRSFQGQIEADRSP
jgi:hypothetical protein